MNCQKIFMCSSRCGYPHVQDKLSKQHPILLLDHQPHLTSTSPTRLSKLPPSRRPNKIPRPTRPTINPPLIPKPIDAIPEERVTRSRINQREIRIQNPAPPSFYIRPPFSEKRIPFFSYEPPGPDERGARRNGHDVDAVDEGGFETEVRCLDMLVYSGVDRETKGVLGIYVCLCLCVWVW